LKVEKKMTTIYLIRHCESAGNVQMMFQGSTDTEVTPKGRLQLEKLAEACRDLSFDRVYVSPLKRARHTAEAVAKQHAGIPVTIEPELTEIDGGEWEGMQIAEIERNYPEEEQLWREDFSRFQAPGGESVKDLYIRGSAVLRRLAEDNPDTVIVLVSHGALIFCMLSYAAGCPANQLDGDFWVENTGISKLSFTPDDQGGRFNIDFVGRIDHLDTDDCKPTVFVWRTEE
jgi:probable phosphoglycerate mutase